MTAVKIHSYQKVLSDLKVRLVREKQQMLEQVERPVGNTGFNDIVTSSLRPDTVGVSEGDEEVAMGLYSNVEHTLGEVEAALARVGVGKFGLCETCGKKIAQARLTAIPYARHCMACSKVATTDATSV